MTRAREGGLKVEGVAGHLPLEGVAAHAVAARGRHSPNQSFKSQVEKYPTQGSRNLPTLIYYLLPSGSYPKYANNRFRFCSDGGFLCISQYLSVASEIPSWQASSFIVRFSFRRLART